MLDDRLMFEGFSRVEFMVGDVRRQRWTTEHKLQIIEESFARSLPASSVFSPVSAQAMILARGGYGLPNSLWSLHQ